MEQKFPVAACPPAYPKRYFSTHKLVTSMPITTPSDFGATHVSREPSSGWPHSPFYFTLCTFLPGQEPSGKIPTMDYPLRSRRRRIGLDREPRVDGCPFILLLQGVPVRRTTEPVRELRRGGAQGAFV